MFFKKLFSGSTPTQREKENTDKIPTVYVSGEDVRNLVNAVFLICTNKVPVNDYCTISTRRRGEIQMRGIVHRCIAPRLAGAHVYETAQFKQRKKKSRKGHVFKASNEALQRLYQLQRNQAIVCM